ncbi:uncharacterized protein HGUI_02189 [Hanseniaspora guilliermondii]|uniref:UBX domain-containing protein n=1 Tax=Hanseniaspora guilliermondii TaxID=56406 RepID=A0A1L0CMA4_9ASCO|nr:uncharacterized protein HGUI_02189 [Hanseniaspora guilliermondii]
MESLNDHQKNVYQQFLEISMFQTPSNESEEMKLIQFLASNDWILESCISKYFDQSNSIEVHESIQQPPPIPDNTTRPTQGLSSLIPQTNNPMMNDLLTRMRFPTVIDVDEGIVADNFNRMILQRQTIDKILLRNGFYDIVKSQQSPNNNNLSNISLFFYEKGSYLWVLWPLISALNWIWSGIKFFLGLQFLLGSDKEKPSKIPNVIVPLPYFKATKQLDIFELDDEDDCNKKEIIDLYDLDDYKDPPMNKIIKTLKHELLNDLEHIDTKSNPHDIQYTTKIKSRLLFYIILNDSFGNITKFSTPESIHSSNILTKMLPSEEVKQFLTEKDQCTIFVQDTAFQVSPWIHYKAIQGSSKKYQPPMMLVMGKVDGLLSLLGTVNLASIKSSKSLVKKLLWFVDKFDVPLGLSYQRYELLDLELSRKLREQQNMEFEKSVQKHTEKRNKKLRITQKYLQMLRFGLDHLLHHEASCSTSEFKACNIQVKMPDGRRLILKLNPLEYTIKKLYALCEVILFLNISTINEANVRSALCDKVEECILNNDLAIFRTINGTNADEVDELDELEIENIILDECEKLEIPKYEEKSFFDIDEDCDLFCKDFYIVSPFPRVVIEKSDSSLIDDKILYPRSNVCIEFYGDDDEDEE